MAGELSTLSSYRLTKMRERVERLERALIEREAEGWWFRSEVDPPVTMRGEVVVWGHIPADEQAHFRTLAENELVRAGLVRPKNVREMER